MKDYSKKCWYCGQETMIQIEEYFKCSNCRATWCRQPTLGEFVDVQPERIDGRRDTKLVPVQRRRNRYHQAPLPRLKRSKS